MKTAAVFFLSLCFLILGASGYVFSEPGNQRIGYSVSGNIEKTQQTKIVNTNQELPVINSNTPGEKRDSFITVEDDDDDLVCARKSALPVNYFITIAYASILIYSDNYVKNRLPFCKHLSYTSSYKYILQRVLKI
nr:hypothetical protein [Pedobacter panaciterrae]